MPAAGLIAKSAPTAIPSQSATNIPTTKIRPARSSWKSTLMRLSEMVGRRLRESGLHARTLQLKLRYKDFTTITRAHTLPSPTQLDTEIFEQIRLLFRRNWRKGARCGCSGCKPRRSRPRPGREICWKMDAASAGSKRYRPPTGCATSSASPACRWPADSGRIPRAHP